MLSEPITSPLGSAYLRATNLGLLTEKMELSKYYHDINDVIQKLRVEVIIFHFPHSQIDSLRPHPSTES